VVMQPRSPVLKSRKDAYIEAFFQFVSDSQFSAVLFLSGVDVSNRTDEQMNAVTYYIDPPNSPSWDSTPLKTITDLRIPVYTSLVAQHPMSPSNEGPIPFIPGGGLTRRTLSSLPAILPVPVGALLQFVAEGDNRTDAYSMAHAVASVLKLNGEIRVWLQPKSWQQGLFGTPQGQTLYG